MKIICKLKKPEVLIKLDEIFYRAKVTNTEIVRVELSLQEFADVKYYLTADFCTSAVSGEHLMYKGFCLQTNDSYEHGDQGFDYVR